MVVVMSNVLSGLSAWLVQRLSAVYLLLFTLLAFAWVITVQTVTFPIWYALFAHPVVVIASAMFILALLLHIWVGVRDVILDYAGHFAALRLTLLALLGAWLIVLAIWSATILFMGVMR
jgi:succinate dehydrogenase / fumarate reductase, membrane anchor subunit